ADTRIIAHRGASAYLPEHSREAYLLAYGMGADFLEPDLVLSADGVLLSLHDATLEATTDVAERYPDRARADGRWYPFDFSFEELRRLNLRERIESDTQKPRYPGRWPAGRGRFQLVSFDELIELTVELNRMTGRRVGLYPELKFPDLHAEQGLDITAALLEALDRHGLPRADLPLFIQCFEPEPLRRLRAERGDRLQLVQLIGENDWAINAIDYDAMRSPEGLATVAGYADAIGPPLARLLAIDADGRPGASRLFTQARRLQLAIHPYTFRRESMPVGSSLEAMLGLFMHQLKVEALFTDHPDVAAAVRAAHLPSR
ncbi:MAG: glycerophosphodiester phosphodiesterase, partial [Gammaproteobacteria bacterium HGW-Gammaproteobacteria-8]